MKTDSSLVARYLASNHAELQKIIQLADTKANIIIVLIGVILSLFFNFFTAQSSINMFQIITVLSLFFLAGGLALMTLYPRVSKKSGKFSLIYYKDALNAKPEKVINDFIKNNNEEKIIEDYVNNIKALSLIIDKKFKKLRLAYILFGLAIVIKITFEIYFWFLAS